MRFFLVLAFATLALLRSPTALGADGPGTATIRQANGILTEILRRQRTPGSGDEGSVAGEIAAKLRGFLDAEELGRRAMVDHWDALNAEQRTEFIQLLRGVVELTYIRALRTQLEYEVRYVSEQAQDAHLLVKTDVSATRKGRRHVIGIDYVLRQEGDKWRVYDVITDGVGLIENYRGQFNKIIAKEGVSGLLVRMRKKLAVESSPIAR